MTGLSHSLNTVGFSRRKQKILNEFLNEQNQLGVYAWGAVSIPEHLVSQPIIRVEDGFLRSVGLGADLTRPISWVFDDLGIYLDATRPSRLENILNTTAFTPELIERANVLTDRIVSLGLSKYNLDSYGTRAPLEEVSKGQKVILVPGQVETDASIALGSFEIKTNLDLTRQVRSNNPDAWIIYKPHPDVVAGVRQPGNGESQVGLYCNEAIRHGNTIELLKNMDEVHTMTSLTGFEALLRGKSVHCYGMPFYAGWGLTNDTSNCARRIRNLSLPELVAGALLLYPRYCSLRGKGLISPEQAITELATIKTGTASRQTRLANHIKRQGLKVYSRLYNP
jgi:capsular polysaccharide export protein